MRFFLIIIFSIVFGELITASFQPVLQVIYQIPDSDCYFSFWGDSCWIRIIASLLGTLFGGFIIGSHLKEKRRLAILLYLIPIVSFWGFILLVYYTQSPINLFLCSYIAGSFFESFPPHTFFVPEFSFFSLWHIVPLSLTILSIPVAYLGSSIGIESESEYSNPKSVLNISWYHWLWLYPFVISQVVATFTICFLEVIAANSDYISHDFFDNLFPYSGFVFCLFGGVGILYSVFNLFSLLSKNVNINGEKKKYKWLIIIGIVIFFNFLYNVMFEVPKIFMDLV